MEAFSHLKLTTSSITLVYSGWPKETKNKTTTKNANQNGALFTCVDNVEEDIKGLTVF